MEIPEHSRDAAVSLFTDALAYVYSAALRVAARLGVADQLNDGPVHIDVLATRVHADPDALYRTLRTCSARGVFTETAPREFALNDRADPLRSDHPISARHLVALHAGHTFWNPVGALEHTVRTGQPSFDTLYGAAFFDWHATHPDESAYFDTGMAAATALENTPAMQTCTALPEHETVVDVGGGTGGLLLAALQQHPNARGVLYDQEHVTSAHRLDDPDIAGRWTVINGDMFAKVPNGTAYLLKRIAHDWDDDQVVQVLGNCADSGGTGARIITIDAVLPDTDQPHQGQLADLMLMTVVPGKERTAAEFADLYRRAGIHLDRIAPVPGTAMSLVEGTID